MEHKDLSVTETLKELKSSKNGLTEEESNKRLEKYGFNELEERKKTTPLKVLLRQFSNFIVFVLIALPYLRCSHFQ
jgi:P-type Ca2+ transporter type 2C